MELAKVKANSVDPDQKPCLWHLFVFGFNDISTLVGHFVLFPREREKRDTR